MSFAGPTRPTLVPFEWDGEEIPCIGVVDFVHACRDANAPFSNLLSSMTTNLTSFNSVISDSCLTATTMPDVVIVSAQEDMEHVLACTDASVKILLVHIRGGFDSSPLCAGEQQVFN
jgi:hypothetical protein